MLAGPKLWLYAFGSFPFGVVNTGDKMCRKALMSSVVITIAIMASLLVPDESSAAIRVALMDFSVDDNSYRSAEAAANFASLLQIELANEAGFDWVERVQLALAKKEPGLSE